MNAKYKRATTKKRPKDRLEIWKIVVGILFVVGAIVQNEEWRLLVFVWGVLAGAAFIAWAIIPWVKAKKEKRDLPSNPNVASVTFTTKKDKAKKEKRDLPSNPKPVSSWVWRKDWMDGAPLAYNYVLPFDEVKSLGQAEVEAAVQSNGDIVEYLVSGELVGRTQDENKARMVSDFCRAGDPCIAYIMPDRKQVNLRFFRDRRKGQERKEQTVITPLAYKGKARQELISTMRPGQPLKLDEDEDPGALFYAGEVIAKLPAKECRRAIDDGVYGIFLENVEEEKVTDETTFETKYTYIPSVRIIW